MDWEKCSHDATWAARGGLGAVVLPAQQLRQLGDVGGDAPRFVAGELGPRQLLPGHGEKMLAYNVEQRFGTGETMRRREFIALMGASVTWPFAALAQEPGWTYRLGALWGGQRGVDNSLGVSLRSAFLDPARRHGFIEGQNLTVDDRVYASPAYPFSEWADELVKARVDVIVAAGDLAIRAAQKATKTIPILGITDDMLGAGLVPAAWRCWRRCAGLAVIRLLCRPLVGQVLIDDRQVCPCHVKHQKAHRTSPELDCSPTQRL